MSNENAERIRERILSLIDSEFESDAAFERVLGLNEKTVNNWRRGRSASYMKMLPRLSGLSVSVTMIPVHVLALMSQIQVRSVRSR